MATVWRLRRAWRAAASDVSFRGLASVIPKVTQVDNSSDFLGKIPHRQHPGIVHLKAVRLPPELIESARFLMAESSVRDVKQQAKALTNYLWSRKRPLETEELCRRAQQLEQKLKAEVATQDPLSQLDRAKEKALKQKVLKALRKTTYHWVELNYTEELSFLYMAARMDGMFAAVSRAFHEIQKRVPDFQPSTLLDFGSGTGTVSWAAHNIWGKTLKEYMNIDSSTAMLALAERLMKGTSPGQNLCFPGVYFRQFLPVSPKVKFDLVVSAFSLNELPSYSQREETVQTLWRKTDSFLVLVENGTKEGHQMLMEARDVILKGTDKVVHDSREPHIFAPCPHHLPCPRLASSDCTLPCNFIQAYHPLPFSWNPDLKEERFSFLIMQRGSGETNESWPRITQPVLCRARHVHVHLCCADGSLQHAVITAQKHGRDLYRCARKSHCGDQLPVLNLDSEPALEEQMDHMNKGQS
ncbi:methyltransferase-like protein 17, mitochondrial [Eublepharis macularius]|uniref:Ribosome assembly protein METTL17, mitochondrial n=1 Tax=Eublepharis macularius TaxID=481883 RepID=A0AA97LCP1_EUBMA|nr:methyltransferase-like protein 17, mitochondrial [Eublepharis macularius]